jgi:hypothetical protein
MLRKVQLSCLWLAMGACSWMALPQSNLPPAMAMATAESVRGGDCAGGSGVGVGAYVCGWTFCWIGGWNDMLVVLTNCSGYIKSVTYTCPCSTRTFDCTTDACDPPS